MSLTKKKTIMKIFQTGVSKAIFIIITNGITMSKNIPLSFLASPEFTELGELFGRVGFGGKSTSLSAFLSAHRIHHRIRELSLFFTLEGLDKPVVSEHLAGPSNSPLSTSREL